MPRSFLFVLVGCLGVAGVLVYVLHRPRVVLYCSQDQEFAVDALAQFHEKTGLTAQPTFDTEGNKSISLYTNLVSEKTKPRCDVFWNNEMLNTIRLQRQGLLEPYDSPSAAAFPSVWRAADHTWTAFAGRARILIVNTKLVPEAERPKGLLELTDPRWKDRVAIAKPTGGTTATQASCLFQVMGKDAARKWYLGLRENKVHVVSGNKQVAEEVGSGQFAVGLTDTDDAMAEVEAGHPVAIIFPDADGMGTLFIPNTLMLIRGAPDPEGGRKLVDFLLSPEVEKKLAESASHQIPLNPNVSAKLPPEIQTPKTVKPMDVDWEKATDLFDEVQVFVTKEFLRP